MLSLDLNGVVCAEGCITGFDSVHSRPKPPGQLSVLLTSVAEGKSVPPPTPSPFDNNKVEVGPCQVLPCAFLIFRSLNSQTRMNLRQQQFCKG